MNIKLVSIVSALAISAAVAQDYDDEYEEAPAAAAESTQEEASEPEPAPAPAPAAPAVADDEDEAPVAKTEEVAAPAEQAKGLDVLHGHAYNTVGNEAAASTVRGNMAVPYKMAGAKLFYVEPTDKYGALALGSGSMT